MVITDAAGGTVKEYGLGTWSAPGGMAVSTSISTLASGLSLSANRVDFAADVTGDGRDDFLTVEPSGVVMVAVAYGETPQNSILQDFGAWSPLGAYPCVAPAICLPADLSGDGRSDLVVFTNDSFGTVRASWAR